MTMSEMFLERGVAFLFFWGIWLLAPLVVDVSTAIVYLVMVLFVRDPNRDLVGLELDYYPLVSVVIPVYNSAETLGKCLQSLYDQNYPLDRLQVICVNNGSVDDSFFVYEAFQSSHHGLYLNWVNMDQSGKSIALNAGIYMMHGQYVINVDSDAWLDNQAVKNMVAAFEADPHLIAATGGVQIDKPLVGGTDFLDIVHYCEQIEYLIAFNVGRRYQSATNSIFTLAGAFSAFRRDVLYNTFLYSERTVSEDTDLTFHLHEKAKLTNGRIGGVVTAIAYVEPITSIRKLYSQRLRWQRGELEVAAHYFKKRVGFFSTFSNHIGRLLIIDHTLAFSRLTWTFIIPFLYFLGYRISVVMAAVIALYICYLVLEFLYYVVALKQETPEHQREAKKIWWVVFFVPIFRFATYWFRLAGIIAVVTEKSVWQAEDPVTQLGQAVTKLKQQVKSFRIRFKR
ncbi:MAG: TIGR03111 family XrtG-associated glycosyltransferase [Methanomassiliicoccales archaeon]